MFLPFSWARSCFKGDTLVVLAICSNVTWCVLWLCVWRFTPRLACIRLPIVFYYIVLTSLFFTPRLFLPSFSRNLTLLHI